jgi:hypothetical protein
VPVALCDVHHVRFWSHGGPTDLGNLVAACPRHHSAIHAGVWGVEFRGGLPWVIPPRWVDPWRRPVRDRLPDAVQAAVRLAQSVSRVGGGSGDRPPPPEPEPP